MTLLAVRNVWKTYGDHVVLERVNLRVAAREFCAIVGASGCGKTTFLRMLLGEEEPCRGEILLSERPLPGEPGPDRGVVFQRYSVFPHLTVLENVRLGLEFACSPFLGRLFGPARRRATDEAMAYLEAVGLAGSREKFPQALSGGMQQRLALAQALVKKPAVLLLDEPFGALDPGTRKDMQGLILKLWSDNPMTVFMVTHDLQEGFALATRLLVFDKPRIDPQAPDAFGATITYDLPLTRKTGQAALARELEAEQERTENDD
jgi:NitT/TauT family transport system ATP-binding protein